MIITDEDKLKKECKDVSLIEAHGIIYNLENELMDSDVKGVGLSANQIDIDAKVCIIRSNNKLNLVNPIIVEKYDLSLFKNEGCLSYPNQWITTKRFNEIIVKDLLHPAGIICIGFDAVIIQHEVGHLYGETMFDYQIQIPQGPNASCWCGSNKKYKKCCIKKEIKTIY